MSRPKPERAANPKGWTDYAGAMDLTTLGEEQIRTLAQSRQIDARQYGSRIIFRISSIEAFMEQLPPAFPMQEAG